jgi:hypothetical protein
MHSTTLATRNREATMPTAPTVGKMVTANAAPSCWTTAAITTNIAAKLGRAVTPGGSVVDVVDMSMFGKTTGPVRRCEDP